HLGLPVVNIGPVAVAIASFAGVHLGHADVIRRTVAAASQSGAAPTLITFEPHPRCVLDPANCPQSITTLQEKLALLEAAGVEHAIVLRFERALASLGPQEFIEMLGSRLDIKHWVIGFDFAFGNQRRGNALWRHAATRGGCPSRFRRRAVPGPPGSSIHSLPAPRHQVRQPSGAGGAAQARRDRHSADRPAVTSVVVIGGGIAGYCAAIGARREGAEVTVVAKAPGATALYAGAMEVVDDLEALLKNEPHHPFSRLRMDPVRLSTEL